VPAMNLDGAGPRAPESIDYAVEPCPARRVDRGVYGFIAFARQELGIILEWAVGTDIGPSRIGPFVGAYTVRSPRDELRNAIVIDVDKLDRGVVRLLIESLIVAKCAAGENLLPALVACI